jgi:hypothetical protein
MLDSASFCRVQHRPQGGRGIIGCRDKRGRKGDLDVPFRILSITTLQIKAGLTVRLVYGLALRQTEGFLQSISALLDLGLRIPDHTTLSRRSKDLNVRMPVSANDEPLHIMVDSTGLRVHSGNVSGSSPPRRRAWRKLHIVVNADNGDILAHSLTTHRARDAAQVPVLLAQIDDPLASAMADGAYDTSSVYAAIEAHGSGPPPQILIPEMDPETWTVP